MSYKYHILTYGCQMNKNDSERIGGMLDDNKYQAVSSWEEADLVILNSCSIRDKSERKVYGRLHEVDHYRRKYNKNIKIVLSGCMPQYLKGELIKKVPFVDYIIGTNNIEDLINQLDKKEKLSNQIENISTSRNEENLELYESLRHQHRDEHNRAWVSIMFGCDNFCSYCIVPYTRGRELSRKKEDIFREIGELEGSGIDSIVLLGQNVNSYGKKRYKDYFFPELLGDIAAKFSWIKKIDFLTSHPKDISPKLASVIATYKNIHNEVHFPLQHADDEILKAMRRGYTLAEYKEKVRFLREIVPGVSIGSDFIVGFPGESEEQFNNLIEAVKEIKFDWANTAAYSDRPGTKSSGLTPKVSENEKNRRLNVLNNLLKELNKK